jgi:hypothetical protein
MNKGHRIRVTRKVNQAHSHNLTQPSAIGAVLGLTGGTVFPLLGALFLAIAWLTGHTGGWLYTLGSILLLATIPLLLIGAHCLDLMDGQKKPRQRQRKPEPENTRQVERTGYVHAKALGIACLSLLLCGGFATAHAQQTIFNVPTTDVLDKGKVYAELDVSFKPNDSEIVNRFSSFVPRFVVGAGARVEVGLNVTGNIQPGPDTTTLVPAVKWKAYQGKDNCVAIVFGDHLFLPVRRRAVNAGNYVYIEISKTFKTGTRLTAGGYDFTRRTVAEAGRAGGQFGFEQPVSRTLTLAADWFTGKHSAGYFTPGVVFKLGPQTTAYAGYSIGNQHLGRGNHFFLLEVGYNFN